VERLENSELKQLLKELHKFYSFPVPAPSDIYLQEQEEHINIVDQNTIILKKQLWQLCKNRKDLFNVCILHDWYHGVGQGVVTYEDVQRLKSSFNKITLLQIDVDADLKIFHFLKSKGILTFESSCNITLESFSVFPNTDLKVTRFNRFLGSLWSIYNLDKTATPAIYFPSIDGSIENIEAEKYIAGKCLIFYDGIKVLNFKIPTTYMVSIYEIIRSPIDVSKEHFYENVLRLVSVID
jgi:hypothetical protein